MYLGLLALMPALPDNKPPGCAPPTQQEKDARKLQSDWAARLKMDRETTTQTGIVMVLIPPAGDVLPRPYLIGKFEVAQEQWQKVMGYNPSNFTRGKGVNARVLPVEQVTWYDAKGCRMRWGRRRRMSLGCMTCTATYGSGAKTSTPPGGGHPARRTECSGAAAGTTMPW